MSTLFTAQDVPASAKEIKDRLTQIDPRLGVLIMPFWDGKPRWAIILHWAEDDKRRAMVQRGELAPDAAWDVLTYMPADCSVDEAYGYVVRSFKAWSGSKAEVKKMLERVHAYNNKVREATVAEQTALAEELLHTNLPTLFKDGGVARTKAPRSNKKSDERMLEEYLRDAGER